MPVLNAILLLGRRVRTALERRDMAVLLFKRSLMPFMLIQVRILLQSGSLTWWTVGLQGEAMSIPKAFLALS